MLIITYAPDGTTDWAKGLVLCNDALRSLPHLDFKLNHARKISIEELATALGSGTAALAQDFANQRNTISLKVRRAVDNTSAAFPDPEAALAYALDHPASFPTTGTLQLQIKGTITNTTRYLLNVAVQAIALADWLGVGPAFQYTFNGGLITPNSPF